MCSTNYGQGGRKSLKTECENSNNNNNIGRLLEAAMNSMSAQESTSLDQILDQAREQEHKQRYSCKSN